jgi:hypothetical protein
LGKAGTPFNTRFVAVANQWKEQKRPELKDPQWPYLLAVKIKSEASVSSQPVPSKVGFDKDVDTLGKVFSVRELRDMNPLPAAVSVMGRVTKFDDTGTETGVLSLVLDGALKCEVSLCEARPRESFVWQRTGNSIQLLSQPVRAGDSPRASLSVGQELRVDGSFLQRGGKPVLIGKAIL